jgi:hypothetical protein
LRQEGDIDKFKSAWMRVGALFEQQGAQNVMFVMTLDPFEPGFADVLAIPNKYVAMIEIDGYTDPDFRRNAGLSGNELFDKKKLPCSFARQLLTISKNDSLEEWLLSLSKRIRVSL